MRKTFHDRMVVGLFVAALTLSFVTSFLIVILSNRFYEVAAGKAGERGYAYNLFFEIGLSEEARQEMMGMKEEEFTQFRERILSTVIDRFSAFLLETGQQYDLIWYRPKYGEIGELQEDCTLETVLCGSIPWYMPLSEGTYPNAEQAAAQTKLAYISKDYLELTEEKDGIRYVSVDYIDYVVGGIFQASGYDLDQKQLVLYHETEEEHLPERLYSSFSVCTLRDTRTDVFALGTNSEQAYLDVQVQLAHLLEENGWYAYEISAIQSEVVQEMKGSLFYRDLSVGLVFVFNLVNCVYISRLWMMRKRRELIIEIAFGMGNIQVLGRLLLELMELCGLALLCACCFGGIYTIVCSVNVLRYIPSLLIGLVAALLIILISVLLTNVKFVYNLRPAQGIRESRDRG